MRAVLPALFSLLPLFSLAQVTPTVIADICPGGCSSGPTNLVQFNGKLYFFATSPTAGKELHVYDGTNTSIVADIAAGSGDGVAPSSVLTLLNNKLYFAANDTIGSTRFWLYAYDVSNAPQKVISTNSGAIPTSGQSAAAGSELALGYNDSADRYQLAKYTPGNNSIQLLTGGNQGGFKFGGPYRMIGAPGYVFFSSFLYSIGSGKGVAINLSTGARGETHTSVWDFPSLLNNDVYFPYTDPLNFNGGGHHVYRFRLSNLTGAFINSGGTSTIPVAGGGQTVSVYNNAVWYAGFTSLGTPGLGLSLFRFDPVSNAITQLGALPASAANGNGFSFSRALNGILYLTYFSNSAGSELYGFTGGSTITQITDIDGATAGFNPTDLVSYNGNLIIAGTTSANGTELYRISGNGLAIDEAGSTSAAILSPNPTSKELNVTLPTAEGFTLRVVSVTGQTLSTHTLQGPSASIPVEGLAAGLYFVQLSNTATGAPAGSARFIKE